jgi:hypothetical protein
VHFYSKFWSFGSQTEAQQHKFEPAGAAPWRRALAHAAPAHHAVSASGPPRLPEAACRPRPRPFPRFPRPAMPWSPRATRHPTVAPYVLRACGGPPVRSRSYPYTRKPRNAVPRQHLRRRRRGHASRPI